MPAANPESPAPPKTKGTPETEAIPLYDRFVLWMFMLGFVFFGVILLSELLAGLFR